MWRGRQWDPGKEDGDIPDPDPVKYWEWVE